MTELFNPGNNNIPNLKGKLPIYTRSRYMAPKAPANHIGFNLNKSTPKNLSAKVCGAPGNATNHCNDLLRPLFPNHLQ